MRLLNATSTIKGEFELKRFDEDNVPIYAILSHTWEGEEVSLQDILDEIAPTKERSWAKIQDFARLAAKRGLEWVWVDTCCIDKTSSAELSESINSMFNYYKHSAACYIYLSDFKNANYDWSDADRLRSSRWFTRGWTLQELIAPEDAVFYDCNWNAIGTRFDLRHEILQATGVPNRAMHGKVHAFSVAQRMSWMSRRQTTRAEDMAYSMLGLFSINIPLLYGEGGDNAFIRLQEEIMKESDDHSLFAWLAPESVAGDQFPDGSRNSGLLATSPKCFHMSGSVVPCSSGADLEEPYEYTKRRVRIKVQTNEDVSSKDLTTAALNCIDLSTKKKQKVGILLRGRDKSLGTYTRITTPNFLGFDSTSLPTPQWVAVQAVERSSDLLDTIATTIALDKVGWKLQVTDAWPVQLHDQRVRVDLSAKLVAMRCLIQEPWLVGPKEHKVGGGLPHVTLWVRPDGLNPTCSITASTEWEKDTCLPPEDKRYTLRNGSSVPPYSAFTPSADLRIGWLEIKVSISPRLVFWEREYGLDISLNEPVESPKDAAPKSGSKTSSISTELLESPKEAELASGSETNGPPSEALESTNEIASPPVPEIDFDIA